MNDRQFYEFVELECRSLTVSRVLWTINHRVIRAWELFRIEHRYTINNPSLLVCPLQVNIYHSWHNGGDDTLCDRIKQHTGRWCFRIRGHPWDAVQTLLGLRFLFNSTIIKWLIDLIQLYRIKYKISNKDTAYTITYNHRNSYNSPYFICLK